MTTTTTTTATTTDTFKGLATVWQQEENGGEWQRIKASKTTDGVRNIIEKLRGTGTLVRVEIRGVTILKPRRV